MSSRKLGIAVVGLGGAVGTTMVAGVELIRQKLVSSDGLPLAELAVSELANYSDIEFAGWDLFPDQLAKAAEHHDVLTHKQFVAVQDTLRSIKPWPAISDSRFLANVEGTNVSTSIGHREAIDKTR